MAKYKIKKEKESKKGKTSKRLKEQKVLNDNELEIKHFFIILIIVLVIVLALYFISKVIVNKRSSNTTNNNITLEIDYDLVTVGTLLNRPYDDYYVLVYDTTDTNSIYYANLFTKYDAKEDGLKIYFCDLSNPLNKDYISDEEEGNPYAKTTDDFSFGRVTLLRIRYGQVVTYLEDIDAINQELN